MSEITQQMTIHGRVQGVGYRDALCRQAIALGITGWVRNRRAGSVEVVATGSQEALHLLAVWARRGPSLARVSRVDVEPVACPEATPPGFEIRPTA